MTIVGGAGAQARIFKSFMMAVLDLIANKVHIDKSLIVIRC